MLIDKSFQIKFQPLNVCLIGDPAVIKKNSLKL